MRLLLASMLVCLSLCASTSRAAPTAEELLKSWQAASDFPDFSYAYTSATNNISPALGKNMWTVDEGFEHWCRDGRFESFKRRWGHLEAPDSDLDPLKVYVIRNVYRPDDRDMPFVSVTWRVKPPATELVANYVEIRHPDAIERATYDGSLDARMLGSDFTDPTYLLSNLDRVSVRPKLEKIGGALCYVIEAKTLSGDIIVWLDPDHGYNVARAELRQSKGHKISARASIPYVLGGADKMPTRTIIAEQKTVDKVAFSKVGDRWVPVKRHVTFARHSQEDFPPIEGESYIERTNIVLNPDFEKMGAFKIEVPDETRVLGSENGGVAMVWRQGKVVPAVDLEDIERIDDAVKDAKGTKPPASKGQ